ncbi:MAG: YciI family protein [Candidatus Methylacidiphilales bacterium]|nr:YciI family protein [Candidatus Methylacidiphilales bacterium]
MNAPQPAASNGYLLLFRGTAWHEGLSAEEIQQVMTRWYSWFDKLTKEGKLKTGQPLANEGKVVAGKGGHTVTDGPFAESKESVGGYFLLNVDNIDEAVKIAQMCPALAHGLRVEVRPIVGSCPIESAAAIAAGREALVFAQA